MLVVTRDSHAVNDPTALPPDKLNQVVVLTPSGERITFHVLPGGRGRKVRVGIDADKSVRIWRGELEQPAA